MKSNGRVDQSFFVCGYCKHPILAGYHCKEVCDNFFQCFECSFLFDHPHSVEKFGQPDKKLDQLPLTLQSITYEGERLSIFYIDMLMYTCTCKCNLFSKCIVPLCNILKLSLDHMKICQETVNLDCIVCDSNVKLFYYHAKYCLEDHCLFSSCFAIKDKIEKKKMGELL